MGDEFDDLFELAPPNIPPEVPPGREQSALNPDKMDGAVPEWRRIAKEASARGVPPWTLVDDAPIPQGTGVAKTKLPDLTINISAQTPEEQKERVRALSEMIRKALEETPPRAVLGVPELMPGLWRQPVDLGIAPETTPGTPPPQSNPLQRADILADLMAKQSWRGAPWEAEELPLEPEHYRGASLSEAYWDEAAEVPERVIRRYLPPEPTVDWVAPELDPLVAAPKFRQIEVYVDRGSHWEKASRPVFGDLSFTLKPINTSDPGDATVEVAGTMYQLTDPGSTSQSPDTSSDESEDDDSDDEDDWDEDWDEEMEDDV